MSEIIIGILGLAAPILVLFAYRQGLCDGKKIKEGGELSPVLPSFPQKNERLTAEQVRLNNILRNIDNYNGSGENQKEVL